MADRKSRKRARRRHRRDMIAKVREWKRGLQANEETVWGTRGTVQDGKGQRRLTQVDVSRLPCYRYSKLKVSVRLSVAHPSLQAAF